MLITQNLNYEQSTRQHPLTQQATRINFREGQFTRPYEQFAAPRQLAPNINSSAVNHLKYHTDMQTVLKANHDILTLNERVFSDNEMWRKRCSDLQLKLANYKEECENKESQAKKQLNELDEKAKKDLKVCKEKAKKERRNCNYS